MEKEDDLSREEIVARFLKDIDRLKPTLSELGYKVTYENHTEAMELKITLSIIIGSKEFKQIYNYLSHSYIYSHGSSTFNYLANRIIIDMVCDITKQILKDL